MDVESPLKGWPKTTPLKDGNGFRVRARYLSPERVRFIDFLCILLAWAIFLGVIIRLYPQSTEELLRSLFLAGVAMLVSMLVIFPTRRLWGRLLFGKTTTIEVFPDKIRIKNGLRFRNYDRNLPHEFDYVIHDRAQTEQDKEVNAYREAQEKRKRVPRRVQQIFRRSFHVVLRYAGQRVDVASVFGKKHAEALLVRLQLLDQMMDAMRGASTASPYAEAGKQYGERPAAG